MSNSESGKSRVTASRRVKWIIVALAPVALFGLFHLLGWRDDTAIISGTSITANPQATAVRGVLYGMSYFATVVASPIILLATGIYVILRRIFCPAEDLK